MNVRILNIMRWPVDCLREVEEKSKTMLHYSLIFLVLALIAGFLGFGGVAGAAAGIAKILFFIFLVIFVVGLVTGRKKVT